MKSFTLWVVFLLVVALFATACSQKTDGKPQANDPDERIVAKRPQAPLERAPDKAKDTDTDNANLYPCELKILDVDIKKKAVRLWLHWNSRLDLTVGDVILMFIILPRPFDLGEVPFDLAGGYKCEFAGTNFDVLRLVSDVSLSIDNGLSYQGHMILYLSKSASQVDLRKSSEYKVPLGREIAGKVVSVAVFKDDDPQPDRYKYFNRVQLTKIKQISNSDTKIVKKEQ